LRAKVRKRKRAGFQPSVLLGGGAIASVQYTRRIVVR